MKERIVVEYGEVNKIAELMGCTNVYNRQIKKFPTEKQNVSLKHILT